MTGKDFIWGVSSSAYQTEGAHDHEGKGWSIWDQFTNQSPKKVKDRQNGNTANDFYYRYKEDIDLLYHLGIKHFRFSISWPRILPLGKGYVNQEGIDFYNRVIDYCLSLDITPWLTLYHWDLPYELERTGGWTNRDIIGHFSEYVKICEKAFGDRVRHWMVMNEPMVFVGAGYFLGIHAPGRMGMANFLPAIHHATISMCEGGKILRAANPHHQIGSTFSCSHIEAFSWDERDVMAAERVDTLLNRMFIEPVLGLGYPVKKLKPLTRIFDYFQPFDEHKIKFDFDFIGIQNYTREIIKHAFWVPYMQARIVRPQERNVRYTLMNWEVYPDSIYHILKKYSYYPNIKDIYITENGAAFPDVVEANGKINDVLRKKYLQEHIASVLKAKREGVNVKGYFVWTWTDNFEWAEGFIPRFGLVHVDFKTQKRTIKESGYWYSELVNEISNPSKLLLAQ